MEARTEYQPGNLIVARRASGTQIAHLKRRHPSGQSWLAYIFRVDSGTWTRTLRNVDDSEIIGSAAVAANAKQRRALPMIARGVGS